MALIDSSRTRLCPVGGGMHVVHRQAIIVVLERLAGRVAEGDHERVGPPR